MTIARGFVEWAVGVSASDIPEAVRRRTALHLLDGLGTALAAARTNAAPFAIPAARTLGSGQESSLVGTTERSSAAGAALANGILMHALDFDDTHTAGLVHATVATLPAALAVAEREGRSGADLIRAVTLGYELIGRLSRAVPHGFHARGFHATSVCGTFSSALVAALLADLDAPRTVAALGIAGSQSSGSMEFLATGAATKQLHPGWASLAGVVAARLAETGASGPDTIIEGEHGLYGLYSSVPPDLDSILAGLGETWQVEGIATKPYPACHLIHRVLDVGQRLHNEVEVEKAADILVRLPADSVPIVAAPEEAKRRPRSPYEAKFSLQWSLAAMLIDGEIGVDTYRPDRIDRPEVLRLSERVRFAPLHGEVPAAEEPGDVSVTLPDGSQLRLRSDDAGASSDRRELHDEVVEKFRLNAGVPVAVADAVVTAVTGLGTAPDLTELADVLAATAAHRQGRAA
jgi:2-methylcitrate dehydratase PrpD